MKILESLSKYFILFVTEFVPNFKFRKPSRRRHCVYLYFYAVVRFDKKYLFHSLSSPATIKSESCLIKSLHSTPNSVFFPHQRALKSWQKRRFLLSISFNLTNPFAEKKKTTSYTATWIPSPTLCQHDRLNIVEIQTNAFHPSNTITKPFTWAMYTNVKKH